ncbi:PRTRC system protein F [Ottowia sp.]|uniref:PRTRC system protein F n=1 Tax=Ottowia sp. TaxID=1898956 RepID=UPI0026305E06|nr:PRTRC system protein F [Ottowia sp.]
MTNGMPQPALAAMPVLALPELSAKVPLSVTSRTQAAANAVLCRFLVDAGIVQEVHLPDDEPDPLKACARAIDAWIKRLIGPLRCLQPRIAVNVLDEDRHHPATRQRKQADYAYLDLYWCEYQEGEWPVGKRLEAMNAAMPGLGATVLQVLREQSRYVYPMFTPDIADDVCSYLYWQGESDEEAALDMMCEEDDEADREAMRDEMVTREVLNAAYPEWARRWLSSPAKGARRRKDGPAWRPCSLRRAAKTLADPKLRAIAADALALSRLPLDDSFRPDIDGEFIGFGAVLSWDEADVTTRIYDDMLNLAHQAEFCDRMGEALIPLDDPGALGACFARLGVRFEAIALIDRLIYGLCDGHCS